MSDESWGRIRSLESLGLPHALQEHLDDFPAENEQALRLLRLPPLLPSQPTRSATEVAAACWLASEEETDVEASLAPLRSLLLLYRLGGIALTKNEIQDSFKQAIQSQTQDQIVLSKIDNTHPSKSFLNAQRVKEFADLWGGIGALFYVSRNLLQQ